uniref:Contactin 3b n=1 Tax=Petromyzon marinus TaxID=7757 RepID=S4RQI7_PETMA
VTLEQSLCSSDLDPFPVEERDPVHVRLHAGLVLVCAPPPHSPGLGLRFRWLFNEFPALVQQDARRYVSQATGDLYVARAEAGDGGRYSCYVTASIMGSHTSVLSSFVSLGLKKDGELAPHVELSLPPVTRVLAGHDVRLECFALGNPVPGDTHKKRRYTFKKATFSRTHESNAIEVIVKNRQLCVRSCLGKRWRARPSPRLALVALSPEPPSWVRGIPPAELDIGDRLSWACEARGHPAPFYRWLRDGEALRPGGPVELGDDGTLTISAVDLSHSGMYQCEARNGNGTIYSAAELRVLEYAPHFGSSPDPGTAHVVRGGAATLLCRPRASPHATISWERHGAPILNSSRVFVRERDSSLLILNATEDADGGAYTCVAENARGRANLTVQLHVQEPTRMSRPPTDVTANVSDSVLLPCQASAAAAGMNIAYTWEALGRTLDPGRDAEKFWIASQSEDSGDLTIVKVRLADSGRYTCTARTPIDSVSASATLRVKGPPGPPASVRVMKVTNTSAMLSWKQGTVNNSPIRRYRVEARTPQSRQWASVSTAPAEIEGSAVTAVCEGLVPWTEYEFRVAAVSDVGTSEQSAPSRRIRTNAAPPTVVPVAVSGGGGRPRELTITWNPVHPELRYGDDFGYVVSFRPNSSSCWTQAVVPHAETALYVAELPPDVPPYAAFLVRVGTFNSAGEGPRGPAVIVHSAEALPSAVPESVAAVGASASELDVSWLPVPQEGLHGRLLGYSVSYWPAAAANELSAGTRQNARVSGEATGVRIAGLSATTTYSLTVRVLNGAGAGPPSRTANGTTLKPPPSQVPHNVSAQVTPGSGTTLHWDPVEATENESAVTGYKVLYWLESNGPGVQAVLESERTSAWLNLTSDGVYTVEVRARSPGGDG